MYKNLLTALEQEKIDKDDLANYLHLDKNILESKIEGKIDWIYSEVFKIHEILPKYNLNWIFETRI